MAVEFLDAAGILFEEQTGTRQEVIALLHDADSFFWRGREESRLP